MSGPARPAPLQGAGGSLPVHLPALGRARTNGSAQVPGGVGRTGHRCDEIPARTSPHQTRSTVPEPGPSASWTGVTEAAVGWTTARAVEPRRGNQDGPVNHGRPRASRGTGNGAIVSRRLVLATHRGGLRGRVWVGHRHHDGAQPGADNGAPHPGDLPEPPPARTGA